MDMVVIGDEMSKDEGMYDSGDRTSDGRRRVKMSAIDNSVLCGNDIMDRTRSLIAVQCMSKFSWTTRDTINSQHHAWGQQDSLVIKLMGV